MISSIFNLNIYGGKENIPKIINRKHHSSSFWKVFNEAWKGFQLSVCAKATHAISELLVSAHESKWLTGSEIINFTADFCTLFFQFVYRWNINIHFLFMKTMKFLHKLFNGHLINPFLLACTAVVQHARTWISRWRMHKCWSCILLIFFWFCNFNRLYLCFWMIKLIVFIFCMLS